MADNANPDAPCVWDIPSIKVSVLGVKIHLYLINLTKRHLMGSPSKHALTVENKQMPA